MHFEGRFDHPPSYFGGYAEKVAQYRGSQSRILSVPISSYCFAIWSTALIFSDLIELLLKRTNPGSMLLGWDPVGVLPAPL